MSLRQCDKCSEMVDEAKAFCPACGHALINEEKRQEASTFDKLDRTVTFGQTMYNQMLEDMGLNIDSSRPSEPRVETVKPISIEAPATTSKNEIVVAVATGAVEKPEKRAVQSRSGSKTKWYVLIGIAAVLLFSVAVVSAIFLVVELLSRLK